MDVFTESQRFCQGWLWILLGFTLLIFIGSLSIASGWNDPIVVSGFIPLLLVILILYVWRLDTRLDAEGVHYRVSPVLPWRTISWDSIQSVSVSEYGFVGYGIRWSFDGWVYNVAGNKGLRIVYPDGHQITIGTQQPSNLQRFLDQLLVRFS